MGLDAASVVRRAVGPQYAARVDAALSELELLGAIGIKKGPNPCVELLPLGRTMSKLNCSFSAARALILGALLGVAHETAYMIAADDANPDLWRKTEDDEILKSRTRWARREKACQFSDHAVNGRAVEHWYNLGSAGREQFVTQVGLVRRAVEEASKAAHAHVKALERLKVVGDGASSDSAARWCLARRLLSGMFSHRIARVATGEPERVRGLNGMHETGKTTGPTTFRVLARPDCDDQVEQFWEALRDKKSLTKWFRRAGHRFRVSRDSAIAEQHTFDTPYIAYSSSMSFDRGTPTSERALTRSATRVDPIALALFAPSMHTKRWRRLALANGTVPIGFATDGACDAITKLRSAVALALGVDREGVTATDARLRAFWKALGDFIAGGGSQRSLVNAERLEQSQPRATASVRIPEPAMRRSGELSSIPLPGKLGHSHRTDKSAHDNMLSIVLPRSRAEAAHDGCHRTVQR